MNTVSSRTCQVDTMSSMDTMSVQQEAKPSDQGEGHGAIDG